MWYLLVAAGAGFLATKWQNVQKPRPLCGQNGRTSPPSSPPATPKRELYSSLSNSTPISPKIGHDPSAGLNSLHQKSTMDGFHSLLDKDVSSPQDIKSNKRSASKDYLVNPVQVKREEDSIVFMQTSKCSLTGVENIDNKEEEQLKEELSPSPSSCCSSNSTVINSPVDSFSILQGCDDFSKFQGRELGRQPTQQNGVFRLQKEQFNGLPNQIFNLSLNSNLEGESPGDVSIVRKNWHAGPLHHSGLNNYLLDYSVVAPDSNFNAAVSSDAAATTGNRMLDEGTHAPLSFVGKRQRDDTRADLCPVDFARSQFSKFDARQDTIEMIARENGSRASRCPNVASQKASNIYNADSDAFVSFGLAMAVCFMVSSGKSEMEKMGKVLRETEDLVSDMRKELEERKLRLCMEDEDSDEFFTIEPKDGAPKEHNPGNIVSSFDTNCQNGPSFHAIRKDLTEVAIQNQLHLYDIEEICGAELNHAETHSERSNRHGMGGVDYGEWQSKHAYFEEESNSEEESENDCAMSMVELERKLWQVFQERQEERILELEKALELSLSKLHAKEEELRWWKNRASWLMEQSFGSASGERNMKDQWNRLEGFECSNVEGVRDESQILSGETSSSSAVKGHIDSIGIGETYLNLAGNANGSLGASSTCSMSSGESVLSINVRAFTYPVDQYDRNLQS